MPVCCPIAALPPLIADNLQWWLGGTIVVLGLLVYGLRDVLVFSFSRAWAISGVCFAESIRKRVLWITPLAILGIVLVSQFQRPSDEADTVRQMLKVCLFATSMLVTITAIILACTNLPKEIENRVIFTVVTKPTTRLEIVVGKILGFARVSAAILAIMGVFSLAYLSITAAKLQRGIAATLRDGTAEASIRPTLEYYRDTGLLTARKLALPVTLAINSREPLLGDRSQWILGGEGDVAVPFALKAADLVPPGEPNAPPLAAGVLIQLKIGYEARLPAETSGAAPQLPPMVAAPDGPTSAPAVAPPKVSVALYDTYENTLVPASVIEKNQSTELPDPTGQQPLMLYIDPRTAPHVEQWERIGVVISGMNQNVELKFMPDSVKLIVPPATADAKPRVIEPAEPIENWNFRGRSGRMGYQVRGGDASKEQAHVAVFRFEGAGATAESGSGMVPFEFRSDIERSGADDREETPTQLQVVVRNRLDGRTSPPVNVLLEANRSIFFKVPADALAGGDYDVFARCLTTGHYLGVTRGSLLVVRANQGFSLNLLKGLLIMWLMAILVISVAIFCSTFLSWPIAIVLTLVMLLGRWGVLQLGDALQPGIGNQIATDLGFRDPAASAAVSKSIEALAKLLNVSAAVLPDISQFASIEDLERGVAVPWPKIRDSLWVLLTFGLPITVLAYVLLRNKEVAP